MNHRITGTTMPVLEFALDHNDAIISEAGELSWITQSIQMTTHTQHAGAAAASSARLKRVAGGGSLFMTEYRAYGAPGEVAFATRVPGHIVPVPVGNGYEYLIHRHGFLCATAGIELGLGFQQSLGAGIFGGRRLPPPEGLRAGNRVARTLRRSHHQRSRPRRDPARSPRPRRCLPEFGRLFRSSASPASKT